MNFYDANGSTLLESQSIAYYQPSNCQTNCSTVQTVTTTMPNSSSGEVNQVSYGYDQYNNVASETDTDWGSGSPGGVIRKITNSYNTGANYINANILGLLTETKVIDSGNNVYTDTKYGYDGGTLAGDPNISGSYHDNTNFGSGNTTRGNLTSLQQCLNTSSCSWLTTTLGYDIAGNLVSAEDANSHTTSFSYTDNYLDGTNRYSYGFVTTTTNAVGQTTRAQWDYYAGEPSSTWDLNNVQTTFTYNASKNVPASLAPGKHVLVLEVAVKISVRDGSGSGPAGANLFQWATIRSQPFGFEASAAPALRRCE
jgi:YD repeat-containing protein